LGLLLLGAAASAQDTRRQESRKAQLEKEIAVINQQLKDNAKSSSRALSDLSLVRRKISARQELIAESDREIRALDDSIRTKQKEIDRLQARHDTLTLYYNRLIRSAYKNRDSRIWYMYILSSENIGQAVRRFGYLKGLSKNMSDQARQIQETAAVLEVEKERLAGMRTRPAPSARSGRPPWTPSGARKGRTLPWSPACRRTARSTSPTCRRRTGRWRP
jgi:hypothetical protein